METKHGRHKHRGQVGGGSGAQANARGHRQEEGQVVRGRCHREAEAWVNRQVEVARGRGQTI